MEISRISKSGMAATPIDINDINPEPQCQRSLFRRSLRCLLKLLQHAVTLQPGEIVHEQHAVEMVDLVLNAGGVEAVGVFLMGLAVEIGEADAHLCRPLSLPV